jgi:hypothetical protein
MMEQKNWFGRLVESHLQMGTYDLVKWAFVLLGGLLTAAVWPHFRHLPTDWWGILALAVGLLVTFTLLLLLQRGQRVGTVPVTLVPGAPEPTSWQQAGFETVEAFHEHRQELDRLLNQAHAVEGLFHPVQIIAFRLAEDMRVFLTEMGSRPDTDWTGVLSEEQIREKLYKRWQVQGPYETKLANGFQLRFANRLRDVMYQLGEVGIERSVILGPYIDTENNEASVEYAARDLERLAAMVRAQRIDDPDKDTEKKLHSLSADGFRPLFTLDPNFTEWLNKKLAPKVVR